ncbi:hypothetical protein [Myroides odoratus]|uniref:hypothetical protein n=1 Tax=Myroides odoratus TaxID=256 RepID=UPI0039AF5F87
MVGKNILKEWFSNGKKPPQEQFWGWIESFWHKEEKIPINSIEGLSSSLQDKLDAPLFQTHLNDPDAHGINTKLESKVSKLEFENHVNDTNAHGIDLKLENKADLDYVTSEIVRLEQTFKDVILESSKGTKYKLGVDDDGTLITSQI